MLDCCGTTLTLHATSCLVIDSIEVPSIITWPSMGNRSPFMHLSNVVFPEPLGPRRPHITPLSTEKLTLSKTFLPGYEKERLYTSIAFTTFIAGCFCSLVCMTQETPLSVAEWKVALLIYDTAQPPFRTGRHNRFQLYPTVYCS